LFVYNRADVTGMELGNHDRGKGKMSTCSLFCAICIEAVLQKTEVADQVAVTPEAISFTQLLKAPGRQLMGALADGRLEGHHLMPTTQQHKKAIPVSSYLACGYA